MEHEYVYCIGDEYLSEKFDTVKEALEELIRDFNEEDWEIYKDNVGQFILVDIVEVKDYEDLIHAHRIIEDLKEDACSEYERDDYLDDVDKDDFANQITEIWNKYKKDKGIRGYYKAKNTAPLICKIRVNKDRYGDYSFVGYDIYRHDETE